MAKKILANSEELVNSIREDFLINGVSIKSLCEKHSCSIAVMQRFLKEHSIQKVFKYAPTSEEILFIQNKLAEGMLHKDIAESLGVPTYRLNSYIRRNIKKSARYSNKLESEAWITEESSLFWYILGLLASDGHLGKFNEVDFHQTDGRFIKKVQNWISHCGILYGKSCYTIHISSALLHKKLEEYGFMKNKRYTVPFLKAPDRVKQWLFIRGLFDGDGSLYFKYVSGRFEGVNWQICSGSKLMTDGLIEFLELEGLKVSKESCMSEAGNKYWHICIRSIEGIKKLFPLLYSSDTEYKLPAKYGKFLKFLNIEKMHKQVDDIVGAL